ncbi:unnamed protein product [Somion occarium]|uniref:protein-tyrosine-phosphatase n=1 Tax=Somion occarium TaxID=3059160 RepID=A0ABP1CNL7_9APHY
MLNTSPPPPSAFSPLDPASLSHFLDDPDALIVDIRPHNTYVIARLPNALSLSVPSTLLKRPLFSLDRLTQMLPSNADRTRFTQWHTATRILVYDSDSSSLSEGGNLLGLLRKFRNEGFPEDRTLAWLKGGFHAVWRDHPALVDRDPPPQDDEEEDATMPLAKTMSAPAAMDAVLRTKRLPMSAFTTSSTTSLRSVHAEVSALPQANVMPATPMTPRTDPFSAVSTSSHPQTPFTLRLPSMSRMSSAASTLPGVKEGEVVDSMASAPAQIRQAFPRFAGQSSLPTLSPQFSMYSAPPRPHHNSMPHGQPMAFNPFFDTIRQNLELARGAQSHDGSGSLNSIPLKLSRSVRRRLGELPFEWLRQIARKSGKLRPVVEDTQSSDDSENDSDVPPSSTERPSSASPRSSESTSPTNSSAEDLTRALSMQFYRIELGEQRRLMGVMEHHSKESGVVMSGPSSSASRVMGKTVSASGSLTAPSPLSSVLGTATRSVTHSGVPVTGPSSASTTFSFTSLSEKQREKSKESASSKSSQTFPFSITAGVEKGAKNRYRNIWPFEHARVRLLRKSGSDDDDYMNASYVQPLGTTKRYIATQGPLAATFTDFWTLCWEQNVHVIVMLTREVESSTEKCGTYWSSGNYGPLKLTLLETNDTPERERKRRESEMSSGFFNIPSAPKPARTRRKRRRRRGGTNAATSEEEDSESVHTIKRVFELTHSGYPLASPRIVTQLQYLDWPDLNVPDDPRGLLDLMWEVEDIVDNSRKNGEKVWGEGPLRKPSDARPDKPTSPVAANWEDPENIDVIGGSEVDSRTGVAKHAVSDPPLLLHCSAGVGRTGGFIAVDAVLDGIRREMRKHRETQDVKADSSSPAESGSQSRASSRGAGQMDVDPSPSPPRHRPSSELALGETSVLTMPVSVGHNEVHVPVAGFASPPPDAMDVDEGATSTQRPSMGRKNTLKASSELVSEVKRATQLKRMSSNNSMNVPVDVPVPSHAHSSQDSVTSGDEDSGRRSMSLSTSPSTSALASLSQFGSRAGSSHPSASPISSHGGSSTSLSQVVKNAGVPLRQTSKDAANTSVQPAHSLSLPTLARNQHSSSNGSQQTTKPSAEVEGEMDLLSPKQTHTHTANPSRTASRLNTWRSEVGSSQTQSTEQDRSASESEKERLDEQNNQRSLTFDYIQPRPLHDDTSPPLLSTYDEPIRRVIEDMREQRMSLCQSLRQYVFVHRAIIEGALMIVDEEKLRKAEAARKPKAPPLPQERHGDRAQSSAQTSLGAKGPSPFSEVVPRGVTAMESPEREPVLGSPFAALKIKDKGKDKETKETKKWNPSEMTDVTMQSPLPSPGRQKRGPSPTELLKEGALGEPMLVKRPSVKRKQRASLDDVDDHGDQQLRLALALDPMVLVEQQSFPER